MNHWHNQVPVIGEYDEFAAYISSFEDDVKLPMENYPFFSRAAAKVLGFNYKVQDSSLYHFL